MALKQDIQKFGATVTMYIRIAGVVSNKERASYTIHEYLLDGEEKVLLNTVDFNRVYDLESAENILSQGYVMLKEIYPNAIDC